MQAEAWIALAQFLVVIVVVLINIGRWARDRERNGNGHGRVAHKTDRDVEALREACATQHSLIWEAIKRNEDHLTAVTKRMNRIQAQET